MATDYDAPRRTETDDVSEDSLEELKARRNEAAVGRCRRGRIRIR